MLHRLTEMACPVMFQTVNSYGRGGIGPRYSSAAPDQALGYRTAEVTSMLRPGVPGAPVSLLAAESGSPRDSCRSSHPSHFLSSDQGTQAEHSHLGRLPDSPVALPLRGSVFLGLTAIQRCQETRRY